MDFDYISSQSFVDKDKNDYGILPNDDIQEISTLMTDYIDSNELNNLDIDDYSSKLTDFLNKGVKPEFLCYKDTIFTLTSLYFDYISECFSEDGGHPISDTIDSLFKLIRSISISPDNECSCCIKKSRIIDILQGLLKDSKEPNILSSTIMSITRLVYKKPLTADLFNLPFIMDKLYEIYNNFFFINRRGPGDIDLYLKSLINKGINNVVQKLQYRNK